MTNLFNSLVIKEIRIMKGDTFVSPLIIELGEDPLFRGDYKLQEGDTLQFFITAPNQQLFNSVIRQVYDHTDVDEDGHIIIRIDSEYTQRLLIGKYYATAVLNTFDEDGKPFVKTVVKPMPFIVEGVGQ